MKTRRKVKLEGRVPQAIVVLGRGVEYAGSGDMWTDLAGWRPTKLIEVVDEKGRHTGIRHKDIDLASSNTRLAGANANLLAAYHVFSSVSPTPELVSFAAGRPDYLLQGPAELSEGSVLARRFLHKIGRGSVPLMPADGYRSADLGDSEVVLQDQNKNTKDDVAQSLILASQRGINDILFITVNAHVPRSYLMTEQARSEGSHYGINTRFVGSEDILSQLPRFSAIFSAVELTRGYERTLHFENKGTRAFLSGSYSSKQKDR